MTASPGVYAILCSCKGTQAESAYAESAQESTLRGLRREMRFIMSPPGKRRHNELNAAPPPETPQGTGKPGAASDRDGVHRGESFRIRGKTCLFGEPRGTIPPRYTSSPSAGGAVSLRLGQAWLLTSPGGQFTTKPLLRSPQRGSQGKYSRQGV